MQDRSGINNSFYNDLGERWYTAFDDPVALLRQESKAKTPWILERIKALGLASPRVLDIGCGAGFLSNRLAEESCQVYAVDLSPESLLVAEKYDSTKSVKYLKADALHLPFAEASFDAVTAMDFLEHVEDPARVIREISRVLKPHGLFFFHTFNRNWLAKLVVIKLVEVLVKNTPKNMHVIELFITPEELRRYCQEQGLQIMEMTGLRPRLGSIRLRHLLRREVPENFSFTFTKSCKLSYLGYARKLP